MKILESQSAVLSNYEVYTHLTAIRAKPRTTPQKHTNVDTVFKELTDYLSPPPTSRSRIPRYNQNPPYSDAAIRALVTALKPYQLTKSEVLMIVNLRPENLGLLDCVVEECDERFETERQEEIVRIVGDVLGREGEGEMEDEMVRGENREGMRDGVDGEGGSGEGMEGVNGHGGDGGDEGGDV